VAAAKSTIAPWASYGVYRELGKGAWFRSNGAELITQPGNLVVFDLDRPFETETRRRFQHELSRARVWSRRHGV